MTEFGRYLKQCPAALKDKTRTLSLLKDALKNDLPKFRVLQAAYELGILEAIQRSNPISTDDRLKITTGLVSQYAMLENAAKNAIDYWQDSVDVDILYRALNDADECRESRINSAESTARPAIPIKPQQNPAENLLKIESISQDSRAGRWPGPPGTASSTASAPPSLRPNSGSPGSIYNLFTILHC